MPRTTTTVGEWIEKSYGVSYTRSALIKLLARMDVEFRKPEVIPRKLDPTRQQAFIEAYDNLLNNLGMMKPYCLPMLCIPRTRCGQRAVGRRRMPKSLLNRPAGDND